MDGREAGKEGCQDKRVWFGDLTRSSGSILVSVWGIGKDLAVVSYKYGHLYRYRYRSGEGTGGKEGRAGGSVWAPTDLASGLRPASALRAAAARARAIVERKGTCMRNLLGWLRLGRLKIHSIATTSLKLP